MDTATDFDRVTEKLREIDGDGGAEGFSHAPRGVERERDSASADEAGVRGEDIEDEDAPASFDIDMIKS